MTCVTSLHLKKMTGMVRSENTKREKETLPNILVFGGSGIIGQAIATECGRQGWSVGIHYHHNREVAEETASIIKGLGAKARLYQSDVNDPKHITEILHSFVQDHGSLTLLVWAVGIAPSALLVKTTSDVWDHTIHTNLTGAFHVLKEAAPIFESQRDGAVILVGSLSGEHGMAGQAAYAASKAGLLGLMQTTAREWGDWNIRVNAIFPGWHSSPLSATGINSALTHQTHLLNRTPALELVASTVIHLASMKDISGQIWNVDNRIW